MAEAGAPVVAPPPEAPPAPKPEAVDGEPVGQPGEQEGAPAEQQPDPNGRQPYLTRVLEHIPGDAGEAAGEPAPHAPSQP